jgi:hypothetical protein
LPNLEKLFKGSIFSFELDVDAASKMPERGHAWLILCGKWSHITGTDSVLVVRDKNPQFEVFRSTIPAATASGSYPLFNNLSDVNQAAWQPLFVLDNQEVVISGGTGFNCRLVVLDFNYR